MAKEAFCLVMWKAHGGLINSDGLPTGPVVPSLCEAPEDCAATCDLMRDSLKTLPSGLNYLWVCPDCINQVFIRSKELHISVQVSGHYTSGLCQRPLCQRVPRTRGTGYEFSNFLQLLVVVGDQIP